MFEKPLWLKIGEMLLAEYQRLEFLHWWRWSRCHDGMWDDLQ